MAANYYETLGISKSASAEEIKKAYRKQALEWHPDKHTDNKSRAEAKFKEINEAYQVLSNPQKKQSYDQYGDAGVGGSPFGARSGGSPFGGQSYTYSTSGENPFGDFGDPFDIFAQFFSGNMGGARRAKPRYSMVVDFMEAIKGVSKTVEINGTRRTIKIPAGVNTGNTIDFGDFSVSVSVSRHKTFEREGDDIHISVSIPISMAILGGEIEVPTVLTKIKIKVRSATQAGTMVRLHGEGAPKVNGRGRGDEYVRIMIETPSHLNRNQKRIIEEMKEEGL